MRGYDRMAASVKQAMAYHTMRLVRSAYPPLLGVIVLALAGAWVSGTLLKEHDGGWRAGQRGTSYLLQLCESQALPSATCTDVIGSRWGSVDFFIGSRRILIPASLVGMVYFVCVAIWFTMTVRVETPALCLWWCTWALVSCGLTGSVFFMGLMAFALAEWCPLCVLVHALNAGIFVCTMLLWRRAHSEEETRLSPSQEDSLGILRLRRRLALSAAATAGLASVGLWLYFDSATEVRRQWRKLAGVRRMLSRMQYDRGFVLREYFAQPVLDVPLRDAGDVQPLGDSLHSEAQLVVFTDYDCNPCACFDGWRALLVEAAFEGYLHVETRYLPLESEQQSPRTDSGVDARNLDRVLPSHAAQAARLQDDKQAFFRMHELLFEHRRDHPRRDYVELARSAGLDVGRFAADLHSSMVRQAVDQDVELAQRLGVSTVPTVFLNGRRVPDVCLESPVFWQSVAARLSDGSTLALAEPRKKVPGQ